MIDTEAVFTLSVTPESRNVSEGKMVEFICASPDTGVIIGWNTAPIVGNPIIIEISLPGGGKQSNYSFTATAQRNKTVITCIVTKDGYVITNSALLLIQGKNDLLIIVM